MDTAYIARFAIPIQRCAISSVILPEISQNQVSTLIQASELCNRDKPAVDIRSRDLIDRIASNLKFRQSGSDWSPEHRDLALALSYNWFPDRYAIDPDYCSPSVCACANPPVIRSHGWQAPDPRPPPAAFLSLCRDRAGSEHVVLRTCGLTSVEWYGLDWVANGISPSGADSCSTELSRTALHCWAGSTRGITKGYNCIRERPSEIACEHKMCRGFCFMPVLYIYYHHNRLVSDLWGPVFAKFEAHRYCQIST